MRGPGRTARGWRQFAPSRLSNCACSANEPLQCALSRHMRQACLRALLPVALPHRAPFSCAPRTTLSRQEGEAPPLARRTLPRAPSADASLAWPARARLAQRCSMASLPVLTSRTRRPGMSFPLLRREHVTRPRAGARATQTAQTKAIFGLFLRAIFDFRRNSSRQPQASTPAHSGGPSGQHLDGPAGALCRFSSRVERVPCLGRSYQAWPPRVGLASEFHEMRFQMCGIQKSASPLPRSLEQPRGARSQPWPRREGSLLGAMTSP